MPLGLGATNQERVSAFEAFLTVLAIPHSGVNVNGTTADATTVTINFNPEATQPQIDQGNQALVNFDWRHRAPFTRSQIAANYAALSAQQRQTLLFHLLAIVIESLSPLDQAQLLSDLGISLPVDQVVV